MVAVRCIAASALVALFLLGPGLAAHAGGQGIEIPRIEFPDVEREPVDGLVDTYLTELRSADRDADGVPDFNDSNGDGVPDLEGPPVFTLRAFDTSGAAEPITIAAPIDVPDVLAQVPTSRAVVSNQGSSGSRLLHDCSGMVMSFAADGTMMDWAVGLPSNQGGGVDGELIDLHGEGEIGTRAFTEANPFKVHDRIVYVGRVGAGDTVAVDNGWTFKAAGIPVRSGDLPNEERQAVKAGQLNLSEQVHDLLRPAGVYPLSGELSSGNGLGCEVTGWVKFELDNPLLTAPSALAAVLGGLGLLGMLFGSRPETTWRRDAVTDQPATRIQRHPISGALYGVLVGVGAAMYLVLFAVVSFDWAELAKVVAATAGFGLLWGSLAPAVKIRHMPPGRTSLGPTFTRTERAESAPPSYEQTFGSGGGDGARPPQPAGALGAGN